MASLDRRKFITVVTAAASIAAANGMAGAQGTEGEDKRSRPMAQDDVSEKAAAPAVQGEGMFLGTQGEAGILACSFDSGTGLLLQTGVAAVTPSPCFLTWSPDGKRLYAVNSLSKGDGAVTGFKRSGMALTPINTMTSAGEDPCHVAIDSTNKVLLVANYRDGTATSYRLAADGSISEPVSVLAFTGKGPVEDRQQTAHAHRVTVSPDNKFVYVNDLGSDRIHILRLDVATAKLVAAEPKEWSSKPGAGPRSLRFHPNGKVAYCVNELDSTVDVLEWNAATGALTSTQTVELLPPTHTGATRACESVIVRAGNYVYFANRDDNFLASYKADIDTGHLTLIARTPCGGKTPRHIALDPTETWLLVANQDSNNVAVFARNPQTGELAKEGHTKTFDTSPMCLLFL